MGFNVSFLENPFLKDGSLITRRVEKSTLTFEKVLEAMRVGTAFSVNDMRAMFFNFTEFLQRTLPEGTQVETPLGTFSLGLRQNRAANAPATGAIPERTVSLTYLSIRVRANRKVLDTIRSAIKPLVVTTRAPLAPSVYGVQNTDRPELVNSGSVGDVMHLSGDMLSFPKADELQGVFFVDTATSAETRAVSYSRLGTNILNFKVPALAPGSYRVEVRAKPTNTDLRTGALSSPFTVS
ncbi:MAG: DUF4469 domain-containing protein [Rectinemataceae bacterium]